MSFERERDLFSAQSRGMAEVNPWKQKQFLWFLDMAILCVWQKATLKCHQEWQWIWRRWKEKYAWLDAALFWRRFQRISEILSKISSRPMWGGLKTATRSPMISGSINRTIPSFKQRLLISPTPESHDTSILERIAWGGWMEKHSEIVFLILLIYGLFKAFSNESEFYWCQQNLKKLLAMACGMGESSPDSSTQVGAVIFTRNHGLI